ncbi:MAG: iron-containing alcohol dehydrogenase [Firmicutes bacterium]|nr:iron-containing alcohol dehydrogenase [Bacillota bacterium]
MNSFIFENQCKIIFGDRPISDLTDMLKSDGAKKIMLVYGGGSVVKNGILDETKSALNNAGLEFIEYGGVSANPHLSHALEGVSIAIKNKIDYILAIGGGSSIDAAKFIAVGAIKNQDAAYHFKTSTPAPHALPIASIVTIPATGSECSFASIIRDEKTGLKYSLRCESIRPKIAFVNPRYCLTLPKEQIAYSISDILSHNLERYFSPQDNVVYTDRLLEGAMRAIIEIGRKVYTDGKYQDWAELCIAGSMAHNDMLSMGRTEQDWGVHRIENTMLSGMNNIAHGQGLAILFPVWMQYIAKRSPDKVLQFFNNVLGIDGIDSGVKALREFYKNLGLKTSLKEMGIQLEPIINKIKEIYPTNLSLGFYGKMNQEDIIEIFMNA